MFAKLTNGVLEPAPSIFYKDNQILVNPDEAFLRNQGYKMVIITKCPEAEEGYYFEPKWIEEDDDILQTWERHEFPNSVIPEDFWETVGDILAGKRE